MANLQSNFTPVAPRDRERVINVFTGESTTEVLSHIVAAQWARDREKCRDTLVVMGSELEVVLLKKDLETEGIEGEDIMVTAPGSNNRRDGKLLIFLPELAIKYFLHDFFNGVDPDKFTCNLHTTVMVNLGWMNFKSSMGVFLMGLARMIHELKTGHLLLCAVRDGEAAGCSVEGDQTLNVVTETRRALQRPEIVWHDLAGHEASLKETFAGLSGRCVLLSGSYRLASAVGKKMGQLFNEFVNFSSITNPDSGKFRWMTRDGRWMNLLVHEDMAYFGPIPELEAILVHPYKSAWLLDPYTSHGVYQEKLLRSRPEIRHILKSRNQGSSVPQAHCFLSEAEFDGLDESATSPCHHVELEKVLLACKGCWVKSVPRLLELPKEHVIKTYLRRLGHRGLLKESPLANTAMIARSSIFDNWHFTPKGTQAFEFVMFSSIESMSTIHLLTELKLKGAASSPAVSDALLSLAVILSTTEHMTLIQHIIVTVTNRYSEMWDEGFQDDIDSQLSGFSAILRWRGPIWFCVAIWHTLRCQEAWRADSVIDYTKHDKPKPSQVMIFEDSVIIDRLRSFEWDNWLTHFLACSKSDFDENLIGSDDHILSDEEQAFVDKALVRALIDKLAFVQVGNENDKTFAYDLASQRPLQEPDEEFCHLLCHNYIVKRESAARGVHVNGYFCVYTHLERESVGLDETGRLERFIWRPVNLTYVPSAIVREVMAEVRPLHPRQNLVSRTEIDL